MSKHTYIFYLKDNAIRVNEVGTNNSLQDVKAYGRYRNEYKSPDDFADFFKSLKDENGIENFKDFSIFIFQWNIEAETFGKFKSYFVDCSNITVFNCETSRALTENVNNDEIEELEKKIKEKENEIESLNEKIEEETNTHKKEIEELKNQHETKAKELENAIAEKDKRLADLEPQRSIVYATGNGRITWKPSNFDGAGKQPFDIGYSYSNTKLSSTFSYGHFPIGFSKKSWVAIIYKNPNRKDASSSWIVRAGQPGFLYRIAEEMSEVQKGDPIAVMSTKPNDTEVNQWLEENGVKGKTAQYVGRNEYDKYDEDNDENEHEGGKVLLGTALVGTAIAGSIIKGLVKGK